LVHRALILGPHEHAGAHSFDGDAEPPRHFEMLGDAMAGGAREEPVPQIDDPVEARALDAPN